MREEKAVAAGVAVNTPEGLPEKRTAVRSPIKSVEGFPYETSK